MAKCFSFDKHCCVPSRGDLGYTRQVRASRFLFQPTLARIRPRGHVMLRPLFLLLLGLLTSFPVLVGAQSETKAGVNWKGKDLEKRDLRNVNLENANLEETKLFLANLKEVNAKGANFRGADLTSASLDGADLTGADFRDATLAKASFQRSILQNANLQEVDLSETSLQGADLRGANLRKIKGIQDITKADFRNADLRGANLLAAKDYAGASAKFKGAKYDKNTRWYKGFDLEGSGAVLVADTDPATKTVPPPTKTDPPTKADPKDAPRETPRGTDPKGLDNPRNVDSKKDPTDPKREPVEADLPKGAPPVKEVKAQLEKHMWRPPLQGGTKHTYNYKMLKYGDSRKGDPFTDGVPANKETTVYPVRIVVEITRTFTDGTSKKEEKKQTYIFYKTGDFDDWTFKFKSND
ncbi:MAG: hypothetical protein C0467_07960 [Planctomycetaceae bacterium]|nr:hypothetical protein [Planctomycetaceae bacterium]